MLFKGNILTSVNFNDKGKRLQNFRRFGVGSNYVDGLAGFNTTSPTTINDAIEASVGGSVSFDGINDSLAIAGGSWFNPNNTSQWTMEGWFYDLSLTNQFAFYYGTWGSIANFGLSIGSSVTFQSGNGSWSWVTNTTIVTDTGSPSGWSHFAFTKNGTTFEVFLNGSRIYTGTPTFGTGGTSGTVWIGTYFNQSPYFNKGNLSNLRIVTGSVLYSGKSYSVPDTQLTAISGTALLTCQSSSTITDASTNNLTITANGAAANSLTPFGYYLVGITTALLRTVSTTNLDLLQSQLLSGKNFTLVEKKNNKYFAGTNDGFLYASDDAVTWSDVSVGIKTAGINWGTTNNTSRIWSIDYGQGYYVISGINRLAYSTDLSNWTNARLAPDFYGNVGVASYSRNVDFASFMNDDYNYKIYYHSATSKWYVASTGNIGFTTNIADPSSWRQVANAEFANIINEQADPTNSNIPGWSFPQGSQAGIALTDRLVVMKGTGGYSNYTYIPVAFSTSASFSGSYMKWNEVKTSSGGPVGIKTLFAPYTPNHISAGPDNKKIITAHYQSNAQISRVAITTDFATYTNLGHGAGERNVGFGYTSAMVSGSQADNTATFQKPDMAVLYNSYLKGGNNNYYTYYSPIASSYNAGKNRWVIAYDWGSLNAYLHNAVAISTDGGTSWKAGDHETENSIFNNYTSFVYSGIGSTDYFVMGKYNSTNGAYVEISQDGENWYSTGIGDTTLSSLRASGATYMTCGIVTSGRYTSGYANGKVCVTNNPASVIDRVQVPVNPNNSLEPDSLVLLLPLNTARTTTDISGIMTSYNGSSFNKTVTNNNGVGIATTVSKYYGSSASFDGTNDYLSFTNIDVGTGDFTYETWVYPTEPGFDLPIVVFHTGTSVIHSFGLANSGFTCNIIFSASARPGSANSWFYSPAITLNTWHHIAYVRSGTTIKIYVDGVEQSLTTTNGSNTGRSENTNVSYVGTSAASEYFQGYLNDTRIYKGYAKYTANFTPPPLADYFQYLTFSVPLNTENPDFSITHVNTAALSAGIGTTATTLTNTSVSIASNATNSAGIATYLYGVNAGIGSTVITTSFYTNAGSATTVGISTWKFGTSSVRFTGVSNSRLTGPSIGFGTTDFTISFFFRAQGTGQNGYNAPYDQRPGSDGVYPLIYSASNGPMRYYVSSSDRITGTTNMTTASGWHHICVQRNSGITRLFVNGTQEGSSYTDSNNYIESTIALGDLALTNSYNMNANLDDLVVWKGVANYTIGAGNTIQVPTSQYDVNTDPNKNYVVISSTFEDTPVGTTNISYAGPVQRGIALFNGTTSAITGTASTAFYFGTDDYTIECMYYKNTTDTSGNEFLFDGRVDNNTRIRPTLYSLEGLGSPVSFILNGAARIYGQNIGGANFGSNAALGITTDPRLDLQGRSNLNKWNHVALCRKNGVTRLYQNGKIQGTYTDTNSYDGPGMRIGNYWNGSNAFNGYIQDFQVYKGYAKYFPTGESQWNEVLASNATGAREINYTNPVKGIATKKVDGNDVYVIASGGKVGIATNFMYANVGSANTLSVDYFVNNSVVGVATTSAYGTGSAYFNGTGGLRYAGNDLSFRTNDFTIEFWVRFNTVGTTVLWDQRPQTNGAYPAIYTNAGALTYFVNSSNVITGSTLSANQWYHIAVARSNGVTKMFLNGTQTGSNYTDTNDYISYNSSGAQVSIGFANDGTSNPLNGHMNGLRVYNGYCLYTTNFTRPTSLTGIGDTNVNNLEILANFNTTGTAGIDTTTIPHIPYQYYGKEKVGITTATFRLHNSLNKNYTSVGIGTTSKFGSGSTYFNGITYLRYSDPRNSSYVFGTGEFSIEFWVQFDSLTGTQVIYDGRPGTTGPYPYIYTSGSTLYYNANNSNIISTTISSANTWYHVLITRQSGSTKMFIDGSQAGASVSDSNFYRENGNGVNYRYIGCDYNLTNFFKGHLQDFRIYNNKAPYTQNVGVSTGPLVEGAALSTTQTKYQPTSLSVTGGVPGGTRATTGSALPPLGGDYCIEFWGYYNSGQTFFEYGTYENGFLLRSDSWYIPGTTTTSGSFGGQYLASQWAHYALIRSGSTLHYYRNGIGIGTGTNSATNPSTSTDIRLGNSRHTDSNPLSGYISDFIIYSGTSKYTVGAGITFQTPTAAYDINTDPLKQYVAFAATFGGSNGQTSLKFDKSTFNITPPTTPLTAVGDSNYKNLSILANLNNANTNYQAYAPKDPIDNIIRLPDITSVTTQALVFQDNFVVIGDYGYIGISTNGYDWTVGSRRPRNASGNAYTNVGIRSYYLAQSTYFYDIVGAGSTVVVTGEYSAPSYNHTFFSNNGGEDEFKNLWHGSSGELWQYPSSGSLTIPWTGGQSIGYSTSTNEFLMSNSYGTYNGYGDLAINYATGIPTTGINTSRHNWVDFGLNLGSIVEKSGKITKVKNDGSKWYIIGYDTTTNGSYYQLGVTTSLANLDNSMRLCRPGYKQFTGASYVDSNNIVVTSEQFPARNSLKNDIITISGITTTYDITQTQSAYFNDPYITGTGATDRVVSVATSIPAGSYSLRSAPVGVGTTFKYGTKSWYFSNNAAFADSGIDFSFRYGDFQIEFWFNPQGSGGGTGLIWIDQSYYVYYTSTSLQWAGYNIKTGITTNAWYHVAVARQGGTTRLFWDGTETFSYTDSVSYVSNSTYGRSFGARADGYSPAASNYYLDDIRIYNGYCGYTTNFTPPTSQLSIGISSFRDKIAFFSNCEDGNYTKMIDNYYITGKDYVTNLSNYYPRLTDTSGNVYSWNTTIEGYFKPTVSGIHTFSMYSYLNGTFWFDGSPVTSTVYNQTRYFTTQSLSTSTYYPIKYIARDLASGLRLQLQYINSSTSTYTGDFSKVGFATAGIGTVGLNVFNVPYYTIGDLTTPAYRHRKIRGILKGDNSYVYYGDRGFVGYSTNNINVRNFREESYRGTDFTAVGIGQSIYNIFGLNDIRVGIYTNGYYVLGSNGSPVAELGISTNGLEWSDRGTFVSNILDGNFGRNFESIGITSSNKFIVSIASTNANILGITTDFVSYTSNRNAGVAGTSTFTNVGAAISTGRSKFGNGSLWIKPTGNQTSYVQASFTDTVAGDYTMEWWQYRTGTLYGYYGNMEWGVYGNSILNTGIGGWYLTSGSGGVSGGGSYPNTANTWEHYALVRSGSNVTLYIDGVGTLLTSSGSGTFDPTTDTFRIGAPQWAGGNWAGNINDFIFYNGVAKYTSNFTPPSTQYDITTDPYKGSVMFAAPFTGAVDGATSIIYYTKPVGTAKTAFVGVTSVSAVGGIGTVNVIANNRGKLFYTDDSLSGLTSVGFSTNRLTTSTFNTITGDTVVSTASSAYGGSSAYFDGTTDNLIVSIDPFANLGTGDFTIEGWFNALDAGGGSGRWVVSSGVSAAVADHLIYRYNGFWYYYSSTDGGSWNISNGQSFGSVSNNTWAHLAVEKKGSTFRLYRNGVGITTFTANPAYSGVRPLYIGSRLGNSQSHYGYVQDLRMYDLAKYNSSASGIGVTFSPPTSYISAANDPNSIVFSAPFNSTYGLNYYESSIKHPSYFGNNPVNKFVKTPQYLIGIATGGYVGFTTDGFNWSVSNGFNGNVTDVAYNGITTDPKYTVVTENGQIYISGIN